MFEELLAYVAENFSVKKSQIVDEYDFYCGVHGWFASHEGKLEPGEAEMMRIIGEHMDEFHKDLLKELN